MAKVKNLHNSSLKIRGYNYIESADYRFYTNNGTRNNNSAIRLVPRYNTNTSLLIHSETGGTGGGSRFTFATPVYIYFSVSQDMNGNTDTGYWSMNFVRNGSIEGYHLMRKSSDWDNFVWSQGISIPANNWFEVQWRDQTNTTNVDGQSWSHYNFLIYQLD